MRAHHRNVRYRPPMEGKETDKASVPMLLSFFKRYILPHKRPLALCILLVSLNASAVYLMAFYARIVVDRILVVQVAVPPQTPDAGSSSHGISAQDRRPRATRPPQQGLLREAHQAAQSTGRPPLAMSKLFGMFVLNIATIVILNLSARLAQRTRIRLSQNLTGALREDLHQKMLSLSRTFHESQTPGRLTARILSDVSVVQSQLLVTLLWTCCYVIMFLLGISLLLATDWRSACIALGGLVPYAVICRRGYRRLRSVNQERWHTNSCLYGYVSKKLDALRAVVAYAREKHEVLNFRRLSSCFLRDGLTQQYIGARINAASVAIISVTVALVFLHGTRQVLAGTMSLGRMMYVYGIAVNLFMPVLMLTQVSVVVINLLVILQRIAQVLDEPMTLSEHPGAVDFPVPIRSGISINNVSFSYTRGTPPVIRNVSLHVPVGHWVCLMGPSGAGKTTLMHLLARLYDPTSGDIRVDDIPLPNIQFTSLRHRMALVPQEAQIFSGTVRDNITYADPAVRPAQIIAVAKAVESHDFIMDMPVKYETTVGEKGVSLSGGQRQRISIARALLSDPEVILLDDCTSALDAHTEQKIQETLSRLLEGKTAILVSQRVSMAMRCHKICVMNDGLITESGTHAALLAQGGFYARLYAQQSQ